MAALDLNCKWHWIPILDIYTCFTSSIDIDECEENPNRCGIGRCINNEGSFQCLCPDGYILMEDGESCMGKSIIETWERCITKSIIIIIETMREMYY